MFAWFGTFVGIISCFLPCLARITTSTPFILPTVRGDDGLPNLVDTAISFASLHIFGSSSPEPPIIPILITFHLQRGFFCFIGDYCRVSCGIFNYKLCFFLPPHYLCDFFKEVLCFLDLLLILFRIAKVLNPLLYSLEYSFYVCYIAL